MNLTRNVSERFLKACTLVKESRDVFVDFPSNGYKICYTVMFAVNIILIIPTVLLNGASIISILKCSKLNTKVYLFLVLVQSIIDLTVGLLGLPLFIVLLAIELFGSVNCVVSVVAQKFSDPTKLLRHNHLDCVEVWTVHGSFVHAFPYEAIVKKKTAKHEAFLSSVKSCMLSSIGALLWSIGVLLSSTGVQEKTCFQIY